MIHVDRVSFAYPSAPLLLDTLTFSVSEGASLALMGKSGSGKTTLIKLLAGLLSPSQGQSRIQSSSVGMVFQKNALFDSLTALENLLLPMDLKDGITGKKARSFGLELLNQVGLLHAQNLLPHELSGGMQKRLALARALAIHPKVLLCDEPTAGLDPITSRQIAGLIRQLQVDQGMTLFVVTADVERAFQLGDQIALLDQTHWISCGPPHEARHSTQKQLRHFLYPKEQSA